jgi:hypothetical protein
MPAVGSELSPAVPSGERSRRPLRWKLHATPGVRLATVPLTLLLVLILLPTVPVGGGQSSLPVAPHAGSLGPSPSVSYYTVSGGYLDAASPRRGLSGVTIDVYPVASCSGHSVPYPASTACTVENSTLTIAGGAWSFALANGNYYISALPNGTNSGAWTSVTVNGARIAGLVLFANSYTPYYNQTFVLPGYTPLTPYAWSCNDGASPLCSMAGGKIHGTQVPIFSWTSDGVYYVNDQSRLVFYSLANQTVQSLAPWYPLYDNYLNYEGVENTEWITADGSYVYEIGCVTLCQSNSNITFYAVNTTTKRTFGYNFTSVKDTATVAANLQVNMVGLDGNDSIVALIYANGSQGTVLGHNVWTTTQYAMGTLPYFEANNVYWIPQLNSFINVQAAGSSLDGLEQSRLNGSSTAPTLNVARSTNYASSFVSNGVNGLAYNLSSHQLSFEVASNYTTWRTFVFSVTPSNGTLSSEVEVYRSGPGAGLGTWPNDSATPSVTSSEHRPTTSGYGPFYADAFDGYFGNTTPFFDWSTNQFYATNVTDYPIPINRTTHKQFQDIPDDEEQLGYNSSYFMGGADCQQNATHCPVRGNDTNSLGTVWYYWDARLPEFPFSPNGPRAEMTAPGNASLTASAGATWIDLNWTPPTVGANPILNWTLFWGPSPSYGHAVDLWGQNRSFNLTGLVTGIHYFVALGASNLHYFRARIATANATLIGPGPAAPTHLTVTAVTGHAVSLNWTNPSTFGLINDMVWYGAGCGSWTNPLSTGGPAQNATVSGLSLGSPYCFAVDASGSNGTSPLSTNVTATTLNVPKAPKNLSATGENATNVSLAWTNPPGTLLNLTVFGGTSCGKWNIVVSAGVVNATTVGGLHSGTAYCFVVAAWNSTGESEPSSNVTATTDHIPPIPYGLSLAAETMDSIELAWTNPKGPILNDTVYYGSTCDVWSFAESVGNVTSYNVTGLDPRTWYCFAVTAWNSTGQSNESNTAEGTTASLPTAPTELTVTGATTTSIGLAWVNPGNYVVNVTIFFGTTCEAWTESVSAGPVTASTVTGLTTRTRYCFTVTAWNVTGQSPESSTTYGTTASVPIAPSGLSVTEATMTTISLHWTNPGGVLQNDTVYVGRSCGNLSRALDAGPVTSSTVGQLTTRTTYCFAVTAWNLTGQSARSVPVVATTASVPDAPTGLSILGRANTSISLGWSNPSESVVNDTIFYGASCGAWTRAISAGAVTQYSVTGLTPLTRYCFSVSAWNSTGESPESAPLSTTTSSVPDAPTTLDILTSTASTISLSWSQFGTGLVNDTVLVGSSCGDWTERFSTGGATTSAVVGGLSPATTYCLAVVAWNVTGPSVPSLDRSAQTRMDPPSGLTASTVSNESVTLSWSDPTPTTLLLNLTIYYGDVCGSWNESVNAAVVTEYTFSQLTADHAYCFGVAAWDSAGRSDIATINVTTLGNAPPVKGGAPTVLTAYYLVGGGAVALVVALVLLGALRKRRRGEVASDPSTPENAPPLDPNETASSVRPAGP